MDYYSAIYNITGIGMVFNWPKRAIFSFITIQWIEIRHLFAKNFGRCDDILTFNSECTGMLQILYEDLGDALELDLFINIVFFDWVDNIHIP